MRAAYGRSQWGRGTFAGWRPELPHWKDALMLVALPIIGQVFADTPYYVTFALLVCSWVGLDAAVYRLTHPRLSQSATAEPGAGPVHGAGVDPVRVDPGGR